MSAGDLVREAWADVHAALEAGGHPVVRGRPVAVGGPTIAMFPGSPSHEWETLGKLLAVAVDVTVIVPATHPMEALAALAADVSDTLIDGGIRAQAPEGMIISPDAALASITIPVRLHMKENPS